MLQSRKELFKPRETKVNRNAAKMWWTNGYKNWDDIQLKHRLRVSRELFELMLQRIEIYIVKEPTNMVPFPIEPHRQFGITLYRCGHGCTFSTVAYLSGVSMSLAEQVFASVSRELIRNLFTKFVKMPNTEEKWRQEAIGFIENYGFPCIGAWDGFHVYVSTKYTISNMGLIGHNKRFLAATVNAPGSTHDACLLKSTEVFKGILDGKVLPKKSINLGDKFGEIPLVTVGDSAFPRYAWLVKGFSDTTRNEKEKLFNEKLRSARLVTENCYGMFKGRWRILYKKTDVKLVNVKYVTLLCTLLHNLCIAMKDPCKPRWRLSVQELQLDDFIFDRQENKTESANISRKIVEWIWEHSE